ncbi:hypothetical protein GUJ93_ZPchr0004g39229 [Zizania palustris]|uniref:Uncharacterized protein n=1 Tax=Zizania palustris TaxID=103762 RepID=A0A8J5T0C8_ZIZPA|nr:hypothetical protein GUJ93_ZPchr0004g39229 [Zizania palustris]
MAPSEPPDHCATWSLRLADPSSLPSPSPTHAAIPVLEPAPSPSEHVAVVAPNSARAHVIVPRPRAAVPVPERTPPYPFRLP